MDIDTMLGKIIILLVGMPERLGTVLDLLVKLGSETGVEWYENFTKFLRKEPCWVMEAKEKVVKVKTYLRQLFIGETIAVSDVDGTEMFQGAGFVIGYIHPDYRRVNESRTATGATVHELVEDGTFRQFYPSVGEKRGMWIEAQVVRFCREHRDKLRKDGYATFFELENGFVAHVYLYSVGKLFVNVFRLDYDCVWHAESQLRIVIPQLKLKS